MNDLLAYCQIDISRMEWSAHEANWGFEMAESNGQSYVPWTMLLGSSGRKIMAPSFSAWSASMLHWSLAINFHISTQWTQCYKLKSFIHVISQRYHHSETHIARNKCMTSITSQPAVKAFAKQSLHMLALSKYLQDQEAKSIRRLGWTFVNFYDKILWWIEQAIILLPII